MAVQQRQPTASASIYLTLKVVQLVNHFKRRTRLRVTSNVPSFGQDACLGFQSTVIRSIEKSLQKKNKQHRHETATRISKNRKNILGRSQKLQTAGRGRSADRNTSGEEVQQLLQSVDANIVLSDSDNNALSAVAADDKLFFNHGAIGYEGCSMKELIHSLALVHDAINVFRAVKEQHDDEWLIAQGQDVGLDIDGAFIANYEHLLLRLETALVEALTRKALEALLEGGQTKAQRKLLAWFAEFPNNQHSKCTTWPWSVSSGLLAVLWGVCWMYYSPTDQQRSEKGNERISQDRFLQSQVWNIPRPDPNEYLNFGLELTGTLSQPAAQQPGMGSAGHPNIGATELRAGGAGGDGGSGWNHELALGGQPGHVTVSRSAGLSAGLRHGGRNGCEDRRQGLGHLVPLCSAAENPTEVTYNNASWSHNISASLLAQLNQYSPQAATANTILAFPQHLDSNSFPQEPWQQQQQQQQRQQQHFPQQRNLVASLPQRSAGHLTAPGVSGIEIRVTDGNPPGSTYAPPQPDFASSYGLYNTGAHQPQASSLGLNTDLGFPSIYDMGNLPQDASPLHTHHRNDSVNSTSNMPTPVSIAGPRSPLLSPMGDRRPSITGSNVGTLRQQSEDNSSQDGDNEDGLSPKRNYAYKRAEEPPRNRDGKMVCKYPECTNVMFDRKCEWSKHMDKHDRPYKCTVQGCEKLQGFTYSGGLLRHEREVHKMHGGTKRSLFCPHADCKRSSGAGFTRKENLAEHVRRVHRSGSSSVDLGNMIITRSDTDVTEIPSQSPYQGSEQTIDLKRKRPSDAGLSGDETDLRAELKRLRREAEEKDLRLKQLEQAVMALQQGR